MYITSGDTEGLELFLHFTESTREAGAERCFRSGYTKESGFVNNSLVCTCYVTTPLGWSS